MHTGASVRASFLALALSAALATGLAACKSPAPPPPAALPWLVEVASIDSARDAGLTRCGQATCERLAEHAVVVAGSVLRAERGARVVLALDLATELTFADGAEIELLMGDRAAQATTDEAPLAASIARGRIVRVRRGSVLVVRRDDAASTTPPVAVVALTRAAVVGSGPASVEVRAEPEGASGFAATAVVFRGRAALRGDDGEHLLLTGEGARWAASGAAEPYARWQSAGDGEERATEPTRSAAAEGPRGLGTMSARVPGTSEVVSGVRLAAHRVSAEVRDGFARTTVEEEFANETNRTLEGRFVFPLPPDASISRLALYVGDELVEGEIVARPLASLIFKAIVDDTVRPRDPALLEWTTGSSVSLKVFPIPAKGKRRVLLAYDQALSEQKDHVRYVYPLSLGADRATPIDDFSVSVVVKDSAASLGSATTAGYDAALHVDDQGIVATYSAKTFAPSSDFVLRYARTEAAAASLSWSVGPTEPARTSAQAARTDTTDARTSAQAARTDTTDARTDTTDARSTARAARADTTDARSTARAARADTTDARSTARAARADTTDARTSAQAARTDTTDARTSAQAARADTTDARTTARAARADTTDARSTARAARADTTDARSTARAARADTTDARSTARAARADTTDAPAGYFAVRLRADAPAGFAHRRWARSARAFVLDISHSQSVDTLDASIRVTKAALANLDPDDRFVVLACDSACVSYPDDGLARATDESLTRAATWLAGRAPGGSSDLVGALLAASERLHAEGGGQIVYLGDGVPTSGELTLPAITARVAPAFRGLDAHFVGVGHSVDESALRALSSTLDATYERLATGDPLAERAAEIARTLEAPVLREARLVLPEGAFDVLPARLPRLRLGQEIQVFGRFRPIVAPPPPETMHASLRDDEAEPSARGPMREVRLAGTVAGAPYEIVRSLDWDRALAAPTPAVHALWARARIGALELSQDPAASKEIVRLSTVHHVLARGTALLVLENEQMFIDTGVRAAIDRVLASEPSGPSSGAAAAARATTGVGARPQAEPFGLTGSLSKPSSSSSWGNDPLGARGNMWGSALGDSFGAGGLGLSGVGEGGGGRGEGVGLGQVGTLGHGAGTSEGGQGFGMGHGRLGGSHKSPSPKVRMGATSVSGRLPPEVIQRIVRQNFGRFRLCYEKGLLNNPSLTGRVAVRFVIDREGNATSVANGGSDLPDAGVVACVVRSFAGLRFPQPEDGIVTVTYPILFSPPSEPPSPMSSSSFALSSPPWQPPQSSWPSWAPDPQSDTATVVQTLAEEGALPAADAAVSKLLAQVATADAPRSAHQALVKKLLATARYDEAFAAASRYLGLDPDHQVALELYAQAAAVTGRTTAAVTAVDAEIEADPTLALGHRRAAAAFEAIGDERRACAHFRTLAALPSADDAATYHALRCRARLGEHGAVLAEARALAKPGALVAKLLTALESGSAPAYQPTVAAGSFEVRLTCAGEASECPSPVVVGPTGTVVSPWTPAAPGPRDAVTIATLLGGTYRTLSSGPLPEAGADLAVKVLGQTKTVHLTQSGTHVRVLSTVKLPTWSFFR